MLAALGVPVPSMTAGTLWATHAVAGSPGRSWPPVFSKSGVGDNSSARRALLALAARIKLAATVGERTRPLKYIPGYRTALRSLGHPVAGGRVDGRDIPVSTAADVNMMSLHSLPRLYSSATPLRGC